MAAFQKTVKNEYGLYNAREGYYDGKKHLFTHINPANGKLYSETIEVDGRDVPGGWVPSDAVQLIYNN